MTGKPMPSAASFFVADALTPLHTFLAATSNAATADHHPAPGGVGGDNGVGSSSGGGDAGGAGGAAAAAVVVRITGQLPPPERRRWAEEVCTLVTQRYLELASSTLETVRKDEEARQRLAIKREPAEGSDAAGGATPSDAHKIHTQLCLDVQAYGAELARVGVNASTLGAYTALQEAVRPEEALVAARF
jgi:hypothetical protein